MKRYYYKFKGNPYAYGPTAPYKNEKDARAVIKEKWDLKTMHGVEIWEA